MVGVASVDSSLEVRPPLCNTVYMFGVGVSEYLNLIMFLWAGPSEEAM